MEQHVELAGVRSHSSCKCTKNIQWIRIKACRLKNFVQHVVQLRVLFIVSDPWIDWHIHVNHCKHFDCLNSIEIPAHINYIYVMSELRKNSIAENNVYLNRHSVDVFCDTVSPMIMPRPQFKPIPNDQWPKWDWGYRGADTGPPLFGDSVPAHLVTRSAANSSWIPAEDNSVVNSELSWEEEPVTAVYDVYGFNIDMTSSLLLKSSVCQNIQIFRCYTWNK